MTLINYIINWESITKAIFLYLCSMYYRREVILSLMQLFDYHWNKLRLPKFIFLFYPSQSRPEYDFIPYRFGCYSYSTNADLTLMVSGAILTESENAFQCKSRTDFLSLLRGTDRLGLIDIKKQFGRFNAIDLIKYIYIHYPYWTITNSTMAERILSCCELQKLSATTVYKSAISKLPYQYSNRFKASTGKESKMMMEDWEMEQLYWNGLTQHNGAESKATLAIKKILRLFCQNRRYILEK